MEFVDKSEKKQKKNKDKKEKVESAVMEAEEELVEEAEGSKKSKKEKKDKKEKSKPEDIAVSAVVEESESKKDKKKKRKAEETEAEPAVVINESESKKSKKDKKEKSSGDSVKASASDANRYVEHPNTSSLSSSKIEELRSGWNITITPPEEGDLYKPIEQLEYLRPSVDALCPYISQYIRTKGFTQPSPIQAQCWPPLLSGRDVIGIAATGSGKTLAFLIPALLKITYLKSIQPFALSSQGRIPTPTVLILAPTRELAMQSHQVVVEMNGAKGVCIYGGVPKQQQRQELQAGAEIVVATPGRLLDLVEERALSLSKIIYLVLDEADRMLDEGFEPAINQILSQCPAAGPNLTDRQTVMFSATWPESIRTLAEKYLKTDAFRITVGSEELSANHRVTQIVECVQAFEKDKKLLALLEKYHKSRKNRILIFVLYKKEAVELQNKLQAKGYSVTGIHGDKNQYDRTAALDEFKRGVTPLLIATDVAARGLDIPQVEYVLNYSFPLTVEDYVHRIGRTGRGGATGISHSFFTDFDKTLAGALVGVLQEANQEVPQEIFKYPMVTKKKTSKLYGDFGPNKELAGKKATKITFD